MSHLGGEPATEDLCEGLSPCDSYDYDRDGDGAPDGVTSEIPGICFLPPTVDNHLSDPACAGELLPGLDGLFQLAWCKISYEGGPSQPPIIDNSGLSGGCAAENEWQDLVSADGHYAASVRWRRGQADVGDIFRVYIVHDSIHFAHRDLIIDPNNTRPADDYLHSIGYGNEPIKVVFTEGLTCLKFDTQQAGTDNAATCLIAGETSFSFDNNGVITTTFNFPDGNPSFFADFEVSECLSLGFELDGDGEPTGSPLVDTPLADCKVSLSSEELNSLPVAAQIAINVSDPRWDDGTGEFATARLNVLQYDEAGVAALPPTVAPTPNWFGVATNDVALLRWMGNGLDKVVSLFRPEPLQAASRGAGWDFTRMSDFQVTVMPIMSHAQEGAACTVEADHCVSLGTFSGTTPVPVTVDVTAPDNADTASTSYFPVPDTRLHFFPQGDGSVECPANSGPDALGRGCYNAGDLDRSVNPIDVDTWTDWGHVVVVTGPAGQGSVDWWLGEGDNTLHVVACGVARPGDNEADSPSGGVYGSLGDCSDRSVTATGLDNGPADGHTPFEPVDIENEAAIYGLPLTFEAKTCPSITVDGRKDDAFGVAEWEACATQTVFTAPQKGPKVSDNATLYTYSDGQALYIGVEVATLELGNKVFINLTEGVIGGDGAEAAGDDVLLIDELGEASLFEDWHYTESCLGNNSASLCGDPDALLDGGAAADGAASVDGAGNGTVFYEFIRPLSSPNSAAGTGKEDLAAGYGAEIGLRLTVTQGKGGGKGGFVYPDPQSSAAKYHIFTIQ